MQMTGALPLEELQKETDQESPSSKIDVLSGESHHEKNKICEDLSWRINAYMHKSYLKTASLLANSCHASALLSIPTEESFVLLFFLPPTFSVSCHRFHLFKN